MTEHTVIDAVRQMLRCDHCRQEVSLPPASSVLTFLTYINDFKANHDDCAAQPVPAPTYVRLAPEGAALKRDHDGLWWEWHPVADADRRRRLAQRSQYTVQAVTLEEAESLLLKVCLDYALSPQHTDDAASARAARLHAGRPLRQVA